MDQNAPQPENPIIINISEEIINSNFSDTIRMGQNEENANENGIPNESNIYRIYVQNFCLFLEPFVLSFQNNQNIENNYNFNELILDLNKLYSKPCDCLQCHMLAFKFAIKDYLENPDQINEIRQNIIIPTITMLLEEYNVDTSELQTSIMEEFHLQQEKEQKPASEEIIQK